ncbi:hypothetical protein HPB47_005255 [Ixodes persulcatus]|uniref:Uncharacterized protein n=1 Tax=Ixodes persulcatus TaxID=34615 RepID=A0AC60PDF6_IXOPE|nr:hypothetical protein HPB47_005255 [Ixodes persulcatus]
MGRTERKDALLRAAKKARRNEGGQQEVTVLEDVILPKQIKDCLDKGPKYSQEPCMNPVSKLSLIRWMGDKAKPEDRERCVADGVDVLQRLEGKTTRKFKTNTIVDYFLEHNLKLLTSDKEGGFVVLPEALYKTKAKEAIQKNFKPHRAAFELPEDCERATQRRQRETTLALGTGGEETAKRSSWTFTTVELQVLYTSFLRHGVPPKCGGERRACSVGLKTVVVSVRVVSVAIVRRVGVRRGWLRFPETPSERYDVETGLRPLGRISGVIGCVNETMIAIVGPSKNDPTAMKVVHCAASISTPST